MPPITQHPARVYRNRGVEIALAPSYEQLEQQSQAAIESLWPKFPKAAQVRRLLTSDPETRTNWDMADYLTVTKLNYNDHGETHARIVAANGVLIYQLLLDAGVKPDVVQSGTGDEDDACAVIVAACLLHDIGNQVHRQGHEQVGALLALPVLDRLLPRVYPDVERRVELRAFILHAIYTHDLNPLPLTFEAALVSLADGTDVTKGRGRTAFDLGKVDIHSVSALAIDEVRIAKGQTFPVEITVVMNNSAGIFQIEDTLSRRLTRSPLAPFVTIVAVTQPEDIAADMRIIQRLVLRNGVFKAE